MTRTSIHWPNLVTGQGILNQPSAKALVPSVQNRDWASAVSLEFGWRKSADSTQIAIMALQSGCASGTIGNRAFAFVSAAPELRTYLCASSSRTRYT